MKKILALCFILLLIALTISNFGIAESSDWIEFPTPERFEMQISAPGKNNTFLLLGETGGPRLGVAEIINVDLTGNILWSRKADEQNPAGHLYRNAWYMDNGHLLTLRSIPGELRYHEWVVELLDEEQVLWRTEPLENVYALYPAEDGFFIFVQPESDSEQLLAQIVKYDANGAVQWTVDWDESLRFKGILSRENVYIAYGHGYAGDDRDSTSLLIALDDQGKVLGRYDGPAGEEFIDALWTEQDHILLIGNNRGVEGAQGDAALGYGIVAEYTMSNELLWRKEYPYINHAENSRSDGELLCIVPHSDGYLIALNVGWDSDIVRLAYMTEKGIIQREWDELKGNIHGTFNISLQKASSRTFLIANGMIEPTGEEETMTSVPKLTTLMKEIYPIERQN